MRAKLLLILLILSLALPAGAWTINPAYTTTINPSSVASGSVTLANMRINAVDGTAFVDFSAGTDLIGNVGKYLVVTDSAGAKIAGWIKAAGTGETLDGEVLSNTGFETAGAGGADVFADWVEAATGASTVNDDAADFNGGAHSCRLDTDAVGTYGSLVNIYILYDFTDLALYKTVINYKHSADAIAGFVTYGNNFFGNLGTLPTATAWTELTQYGTATSIDDRISLKRLKGPSKSYWYDDISLKKVLTPSATGATITSANYGSTYNWTSQGAGFNYNDASGYTYAVYECGLTISP